MERVTVRERLRSHGVTPRPSSSPSELKSRQIVCPHGSCFARWRSVWPARSSSVAAASTSSTSNSTLAWGTGTPAGQASVPKHDRAASASDHSPKCFTPSSRSVAG